MPADALDWHEAVSALRELEGREVAVRISRHLVDDELVAVVHAALGAMDLDAKQPSLFWPLGDPDEHPERPGLYLREDDFLGGERRAGGGLVVRQRDVVVNVRPLSAE
jgi:hypothetical protein